MTNAEPYVAFNELDESSEGALKALRLAMARHPIAVQAAFSALAKEGREYARSAEGALLLITLSRTHAIRRARLIWDTLSMGAFEETPDGPLPSVYLDGVVQAARANAIESLLSKLFDPAE